MCYIYFTLISKFKVVLAILKVSERKLLPTTEREKILILKHHIIHEENFLSRVHVCCITYIKL